MQHNKNDKKASATLILLELFEQIKIIISCPKSASEKYVQDTL